VLRIWRRDQTGDTGKATCASCNISPWRAGASTGEHFRGRQVLLLSFEDDIDEEHRRLKAALIHHGIERRELKGSLYIAAIKNIKLAEVSSKGSCRSAKLEALRDLITLADDACTGTSQATPFAWFTRSNDHDGRAAIVRRITLPNPPDSILKQESTNMSMDLNNDTSTNMALNIEEAAQANLKSNLVELSYVLQDAIVASMAKAADEAERDAGLSEKARDTILREAISDELRHEIYRILSILVVRAHDVLWIDGENDDGEPNDSGPDVDYAWRVCKEGTTTGESAA
jgi:hypothetical protein